MFSSYSYFFAKITSNESVSNPHCKIYIRRKSYNLLGIIPVSLVILNVFNLFVFVSWKLLQMNLNRITLEIHWKNYSMQAAKIKFVNILSHIHSPDFNA